MDFGEALVPEACCSTRVLEHGYNRNRNSSMERNFISHSQFFPRAHPGPVNHILKLDGILSVSVLQLMFFYFLHCFPEQACSEALGNKNRETS